MIKPEENQTFRLSYNRAYRSPSVINNFLDVYIARPVDLRALGGPAQLCPARQIVGNPDLTETIAGRLRDWLHRHAAQRAVVSAAFYVNKIKDEIFFTEDASGRYTAANPPPNWPLPPRVHQLHLAAARASRRDSPTRTSAGRPEGFELGVDTPGQSLRQRVRQLLLSGDARAQGLRPQRTEPAAEEPLQRRCVSSTTSASSATHGEPTRTRVLAGRAGRAVSRDDEGVHARQRAASACAGVRRIA